MSKDLIKNLKKIKKNNKIENENEKRSHLHLTYEVIRTVFRGEGALSLVILLQARLTGAARSKGEKKNQKTRKAPPSRSSESKLNKIGID